MVVVSTSDQSPLLRMRAALAATTVAEYFAARARMFCWWWTRSPGWPWHSAKSDWRPASRPPPKGYTPSCFTMLSRLIERAGKFRSGSITAFYTVLMEGDDRAGPTRRRRARLARRPHHARPQAGLRSHYPPIAVLDSVSRLMPAVCSAPHLQKAHELRRLLAAYTASEDLIRIGAYQEGSDPTTRQGSGADS